MRAGASWCARAATSSSCRALVGDTAHGARRALRAARDEAVSARGLVLKLYEARKLSRSATQAFAVHDVLASCRVGPALSPSDEGEGVPADADEDELDAPRAAQGSKAVCGTTAARGVAAGAGAASKR